MTVSEIPEQVQAAVRATPCVQCNVVGGYRLELRWRVAGPIVERRLGYEAPVLQWPWIVCDLCGFEEAASDGGG